MRAKLTSWLHQRVDQILDNAPHIYGKRLTPFSEDLLEIPQLKSYRLRKQEVKQALESWVREVVGKRFGS